MPEHPVRVKPNKTHEASRDNYDAGRDNRDPTNHPSKETGRFGRRHDLVIFFMLLNFNSAS